MAPIVIWGANASGPCRIVYTACSVTGADYVIKELDLLKGDQKDPAYLKLNPQGVVPTLVDGDFVMTESRAICSYIGNAYAKEDSGLYPKDPKIRGTIDSRLYFEMGSFYKAMAACTVRHHA